ncbi:hypothetical protein [Caulobacter sp.]|uniref:hypothetical protein n=1 Tax=Caulobacter sp. TaxID=78 RepID=UPI0031E0CCA6
MTVRLLAALAFASAALVAAPVVAGSYQGGHHQGLPLDPQLLPANSGPGDCVVRRVTGPGGAYRWDRVECGASQGHHQWDGRPLGVETADRYSDRHDPRYDYGYGYDQQDYAYEYARERGYDDGYDQSRGGPVTQYPPSYAPGFYGYAAAGRDAYGYLVWPGKLP